MGKLNAKRIENIVRNGLPTAKSDGNGLTFTLSAAGLASWTLRYRYGGRGREYTIGRFPDIDLKAARDLAAPLRVRVSQGEDVAATKRRTKVELVKLGSVKELADDYLERVGPRLASTTVKNTRHMLRKDIVPRIGHLRAAEVSSAEIVYLVEQVGRRSKVVARRVFEAVSSIYSHALAKQLVKVHPCAGLRVSSIVGTHKARERLMLSSDDLRALLRVLPSIGEANALAVKILLVTGVRKSELLLARREEIDLDGALWHVPADREGNKARRAYSIPLPATAVTWFRRLIELSAGSEYVLPGRAVRFGSRRATLSRSALNVALQRLPGGPRRFRIHDLRSTVRSHLLALDVSLVVAERCLNHSLGGLIEVYDRNDYLAERRDALEKWAAFLERAERGEDSNVVRMLGGPSPYEGVSRRLAQASGSV